MQALRQRRSVGPDERGGALTRPRRAAVVAVAALVALGVAGGVNAAVDLGDPPARCVPAKAGDGCYGDGVTALSDTWTASFTVSPKVVHVGEKLTGEVTPLHSPLSWRWGFPGCADDAPTCTWVATAATNRWVVMSMGFGGLGGVEQDYYAVLGEDWAVSGTVRAADGSPLAGVTVTANGKTDARAVTNADGFYVLTLPKGTYEIAARAKVCVQPRRAGACSASGTVTLPGSRTVSFQAPSAGALRGTVRDHRGRPVPRVRIEATSADGERLTVATGTDGRYELPLPEGAYTVTAPAGQATPRDRYEPASVSVAIAAAAVTQDFTMANGDLMTLDSDRSVDPANGLRSSLPADGTSALLATARLVDARAVGLSGQPIDVSSLSWVAAPAGVPAPRAVFCGVDGSLLAPTAASSPLVAFGGPADRNGELVFRLFPGTVAGGASLEAHDRDDPTRAESFAVELLDLTREEEHPPLAPPSALEAENATDAEIVGWLRGAFATGLASSATTAGDLQDRLLDWFVEHPIPGLAVAPIHAGEAAAVLLYRAGSLAAVEAALAGGDPHALDTEARVVAIDRPALDDFRVLLPQAAIGATVTPAQDAVMPLAQWITGLHVSDPLDPITAAHGQPQRGRVRPWPQEELTFLGYPYPGDATAGWCLPPSPYATTVEAVGSGRGPQGGAPHAPVHLLARDAKGRLLGVDAKGKPRVEIPGGALVDGRLVLPRGAYTLSVTGTGRGAATVIVDRAGARASYELSVRKGVTGSVALTAAGAARPLAFGRTTVRASTGLRLTIAGLPARIAPGKAVALRLRVRDARGAVAAAVVTVRVGKATLAALTDQAGRATIELPAATGRTVAVRASAPAHAVATAVIPVRKPRTRS